MLLCIFKLSILAIFVQKLETNIRHYWPLSMDQVASVCSKDNSTASFSLDDLITSDVTSARIIRHLELQCGVACFSYYSKCSLFQVDFDGCSGNCSIFSGIPDNFYYGQLTSCRMFSQTSEYFFNPSLENKVVVFFLQIQGIYQNNKIVEYYSPIY